jgi:DSF synthase
MILSGRLYTAEELYELGVIDLLVEDGTGEAAVREFVRRNERHRNGMQAVFSCRQHFQRISYEEMLNITKVWVDAALRLEEKDLKMMSRLARSQFRRIEGGAAAEAPEAARIREEVRYATA